jgi:membrane protein
MTADSGDTGDDTTPDTESDRTAPDEEAVPERDDATTVDVQGPADTDTDDSQSGASDGPETDTGDAEYPGSPDEYEGPDLGPGSDGPGGPGNGGPGNGGPGGSGGPDGDELAELRADLDDLQQRVDERTVQRDDLEDSLQQYVRWRLRRGHATGWGPYLVLLYGTVMTMGAFYYLAGVWAVLAMLVIWLSTLGLFVFMLIAGIPISLAGKAGQLLDRARSLR